MDGRMSAGIAAVLALTIGFFLLMLVRQGAAKGGRGDTHWPQRSART
jgi:hypothetical protein